MKPKHLLSLALASVLLLSIAPFGTAAAAEEVALPHAVPSPSEVQFGDVSIGSSAPAIVTVQNNQLVSLLITSVTCDGASDGVAVTSAPVLPAVLQPGGYIDVGLAFAPTAAGDVASALVIECDDSDGPLIFVPVTGTGVKTESANVAMITGLLAFYDTALGDGTLYGIGPGKSADHRAGALRNMIEATGDLVSQDDLDGAIQQLLDIAKKCDGELKPPDFVAGTALEEFYTQVNDVIDELAAAQLGLSAEILFTNVDGTTVADASGLTYIVDGRPRTDPTRVYPEAYWGEYALYLPGHVASVDVGLANSRDTQIQVTLVTQTYALNTDGSPGSSVNQQQKIVTVGAAETQYIDASFTLPYDPKGLLLFLAAVYPDDSLALGEPPALVAEAIFCPPTISP